MRITTPIVLTALITACGSHAPRPALPDNATPVAAPAQQPVSPAPTTATASPAVDVHARCADLAKNTDVSIPAARALGDATTDVDEAVNCLADALVNTPHTYWGTEQKIEFEQLRNALASSVGALTGISQPGFDPDNDADANAVATQARYWITHH